MVDRLARFEVETTAAAAGQFKQLLRVVEYDLSGQWRSQILFEKLAMPAPSVRRTH
jgi:hypothetical protein